MKNKKVVLTGGFLAGLINGLIGTGGGIVGIPLLTYSLKDRHRAHSTVMAFILPLSVFSMFFYYNNQTVDWKSVLFISAGGVFGAVLGALLLNKLSSKILKALFALIIIASGAFILF